MEPGYPKTATDIRISYQSPLEPLDKARDLVTSSSHISDYSRPHSPKRERPAHSTHAAEISAVLLPPSFPLGQTMHNDAVAPYFHYEFNINIPRELRSRDKKTQVYLQPPPRLPLCPPGSAGIDAARNRFLMDISEGDGIQLVWMQSRRLNASTFRPPRVRRGLELYSAP